MKKLFLISLLMLVAVNAPAFGMFRGVLGQVALRTRFMSTQQSAVGALQMMQREFNVPGLENAILRERAKLAAEREKAELLRQAEKTQRANYEKWLANLQAEDERLQAEQKRIEDEQKRLEEEKIEATFFYRAKMKLMPIWEFLKRHW